MIEIHAVALEGHGVRLEPLVYAHQDGLAVAAADGRLWELWFTMVPEPEQAHAYLASQRAIEALGAKKDGVIRHHHARRDGTVRDTVMYSILAHEWPDVKRHLELRLTRHGSASS